MPNYYRTVVLDASVLLKFILDEREDAEQIVLLKRQIDNEELDVHVPSICFLEVANTIARLFDASLSSDAIFDLYMNLRSYFPEEHILADSSAYQTLHLLKGTSKISFYDAVYHALALQLDATYITADKKYYDLMRRKGHIRLLKNWR